MGFLSPETVLGPGAVLEAQLGSMWGAGQSHRGRLCLRRKDEPVHGAGRYEQGLGSLARRQPVRFLS